MATPFQPFFEQGGPYSLGSLVSPVKNWMWADGGETTMTMAKKKSGEKLPCFSAQDSGKSPPLRGEKRKAGKDFSESTVYYQIQPQGNKTNR